MRETEKIVVAEVAHKLTLSVDEAAALSGLAKALIESALKSGRLPQVKAGKATAIKRRDLETWVDSLETTKGARPFTPPAEMEEIS